MAFISDAHPFVFWVSSMSVVQVQNLRQAIDFVNDRPKPLALYVFSSDDDMISQVLNETSSGGVCVNDCVFHMTDPNLPFGGVGASGMGAYHGRQGFNMFVHRKPVLKRWTTGDSLVPRYAPMSEENAAFIQKAAAFNMCWVKHGGTTKWLFVFLILVAAALCITKFAVKLW